MDTNSNKAVKQYNESIGSFFQTAEKFDNAANNTNTHTLTEEDKSLGYQARTLIEHTKSSVVKTVQYLFKAAQHDKSQIGNIGNANMNMFTCCVCNRHFDNTANLRKHMKCKHDLGKLKDIRVFPCDKCNKTFGTEYNMKQHKYFKHSMKLKADEQSSNYADKQLVKTHPRVTCQYCNKSLDNDFNLKQHIKYKHPNVTLEVDTGNEKTQTVTMDKSKENNRSKLLEKHTVKCDKCCKTFNNRYNKSIHTCTQLNGKVITCDKCRKMFKNFHNKLTHNCKGEGHPQYVTCNKCFREYATDKYPGHRCPNHCKKCDKIFTYANEYVNHKVSRSGYGYSCYYCKFVFTTREQAKKHQRFCKPFPCSVCQRLYASADNLSDHCKEMHTDNLSNQCQYCTETFHTMVSLKKHVDEKHADTKGDCKS